MVIWPLESAAPSFLRLCDSLKHNALSAFQVCRDCLPQWNKAAPGKFGWPILQATAMLVLTHDI